MNDQSNIFAFKRPEAPLAFAPGVVPFDRANPDHVRAWNSIFALGRAEQRRLETNQGNRS